MTCLSVCLSVYLSQDVDKATSTRIALEKQLENLEVELAFLQRVHKEVTHCLVPNVYMSQRLVAGMPFILSL